MAQRTFISFDYDYDFDIKTMLVTSKSEANRLRFKT